MSARADGPSVDRGTGSSDEHVRRVELDWQALDLAPDVRPGEAVVYGRTLTSADVGTWAHPPSVGHFESVTRMAGGDVGLLPRLSLHLVGAEDTVGPSSGMVGALELWLFRPGAPFRLNVLGGYEEQLDRAHALWTELVLAHTTGPLELALAVREQVGLGEYQPPETTVAGGVAYRIASYRLGVEYVSTTTGAVVTQALVPTVSAAVSKNVTVKASTTIGVRGLSGATPRISVAGAF